jgi:hypothetical protein
MAKQAIINDFSQNAGGSCSQALIAYISPRRIRYNTLRKIIFMLNAYLSAFTPFTIGTNRTGITGCRVILPSSLLSITTRVCM